MYDRRLAAMVMTGMLSAASSPAAAASFIERCPENTPQSRQAQDALTQLQKRIKALQPAQDPAPLVRELKDLSQTPCFQIGRGQLPDKFDSALSLTTWWKDGGQEWLSSLLRNDREFLLPPAPRTTLMRDNKPEQPLASILCDLADAACGRETGGWVERAEAAFALHAQREAEKLAASSRDAKDDTPRKASDCTAVALKAPLAQRYPRWLSCVEEVQPKRDALPLGRVRAPASGWLVVRGRRGHYGFCDETRAYDLASGAAYVAQSCSQLMLVQGGGVNAAATDAARRPHLTTGKLPLDNLREAAWMMLLSSKVVEHIAIEGYQTTMPPGITPRIPETGDLFGSVRGDMWFSSAQTQLTWAWMDGERVLAKGTLTWPNSYKAAEDHAAELLRIAEGGMQPGCPPVALPPPVLLGGDVPGVNRLDAPTGVRPIQAELLDTLIGAPRCAPAPMQ